LNFDALWQTHRRFLSGAAGALLLFLLAESLIGSTARSSLLSSQRRLRAAEGKLGTPSFGPADVARLEKHARALEERVAELGGRTLPPLRQEFRPQAGQSPTQHYIELTGRLRRELIPWANRRNVDVDETLGLPPISPTDPQKIARVLRGLDLVERVVRLAVESGAGKVSDLEIAPRKARRRAHGASASPLDLTPVLATVHLQDDGRVFPFLKALAEAEPPLGLVRIEVPPPDRRRKVRRVQIELAAGGIPGPAGEEQP